VYRPGAAQLQIAATVIFAMLLTGILREAPILAPAVCQRVEVASSDEKARMLEVLARSYDQAGHMVDGSCVDVQVEKVNSGDAERYLEDGWRDAPAGAPRPDVWSPAAASWVALLRQRAPAQAAVLPAESPSLFQSPLVIGIPQPMATALGYPGRLLGWSDIFALVNDPAGWSAFGHPEWGKFKLAKTNPNISTSGLHALVGTYFAAGGDSAATVNDAAVTAFAARIEGAVVHYGETARSFLDALRDADNHGTALEFVSAFALEEQELVTYDNSSPAPRTPLVPVYPKEGSPIADHPYVVLRWSHASAAADSFYSYVEGQTDAVDRNFFRFQDGSAGPQLKAALPQRAGPSTRFYPADGAVLVAMLAAWQQIRRPARILVLVDDGAGEAVTRTVSELSRALGALQLTDQAGVSVFDSARGPTELVPVGPASENLRSTVAAIRPARSHGNLDAAVRAGLGTLGTGYDPAAINALLLVEPALVDRDPALETYLRNQPTDRSVRVFTVGPSDAMKNLAKAGGGASYSTDATGHFLDDLVSNF
jgi:Ca-activated chloride channel homolog